MFRLLMGTYIEENMRVTITAACIGKSRYCRNLTRSCIGQGELKVGCWGGAPSFRAGGGFRLAPLR